MNTLAAFIKSTNAPPGWCRRRLGSLGELFSGSTPSRFGGDHLFGGHIPWVKTGDLNNSRIYQTEEHLTKEGLDSCSCRILPPGTILVAMYGGFNQIGRTGLLAIPATTNQAISALICDSAISIPTYVLYWLNAYRFLWREFAGSSRKDPNITKSDIASFPIAVPSLSEQKRIADILCTWDLALEKLDALIAAKERRKHALVQKFHSGKRRLTGRLQKWTTKSLGDLIEPITRLTAKPKTAFLAAGIRSHGKGVFLKSEFDPEEIALDELFKIKQGDLIVNITFAWEGATAIVPPEANGALVSHRFPTFRVKESVASLSFIRHYIRTQRFVFDCGLASPGGAGRNRVLSKKAFLAIELTVPSLSEQQQIGGILDDADAELRLLRQQRDALDRQKRGLMQRLLTGKVRVKI